MAPLLNLSAQELPDQDALALANKILAKMTLEQKVSLCHGNGTMSINSIPEVGIPEEFWMDDGPSGVRCDLERQSFSAAKAADDHSDESTALPRGSCLAATWDRDLAVQYGQVLGEECRAREKDMLLGPAVNIVRTPLCGRNHEYFGEDPYLSGQVAIGYIHGLQSRDVAGCVKHFAMNNQELNRFEVDVEASDRTMHEIYLPAFEAAVQQAQVLSVMGAYNRFRGAQCCESDLLLNQILKHDWHFPGFVVSDWGGAHDTLKAALGGLDLEMNSGSSIHVFTTPLLDAVKSGAVPMSVLDDKVRRILFVMAKIHKLDGQKRFAGSINTPAHQALARKVAEDGLVLLKNDKHLLPINTALTKTILVLGYNATYKNNLGGSSASNKAPYEVTAWDGLQKALGSKIKLELDDDVPDLKGGLTPDALAAKAKSFDLVLFFTGDYYGDRVPKNLFVGRNPYGVENEGREGEGSDRPDMKLPAGTDEAVKAVLAANPNTVVINQSGTPVEMPWADEASTIVQYWFSGMEGGNALAAVLTGEVNPSGKLPVTFPKQLSDSPAQALDDYNASKETYAEGVFVGYRWFDAKKIEPLFPFGFGLSYTTFALSKLSVSPDLIETHGLPIYNWMKQAKEFHVTASVTVTNTGKLPGAEVVQLYVGDSSATVMRPPNELKGFQKVMLHPGESKVVEFELHADAFAYWDEKSSGWKVDPGQFEIRVGTSSRELPLSSTLTIETK